MNSPTPVQHFPVTDYDLGATLSSGQAFRWRAAGSAWIGVIGTRWVRLRSENGGILAEVSKPTADWGGVVDYLQLQADFTQVLRTFPDDEPMRAAVTACRGLRLLRQDPWECLASFILSSTKQIIQIQQIISLLCDRYGEPLKEPSGQAEARAFPRPQALAKLSEAELRECKMGFRAPYLLAVARRIAEGQLDLSRLRQLPVEAARFELVQLPGVGRKIADCVLLFAYGVQSAFPLDVWVMKGLRQLYFSRKRPSLQRLHRFAAGHFGPNAGYAQQYLFHYMRVKLRARNSKPEVEVPNEHA